jgi:6-phosphogluconate dehydrogenase
MKSGNEPADFAVIGLGRMGGGLALQALEQGLRVAGFAPKRPRAELLEAGLRRLQSPGQVRKVLRRPRLVMLYVPAGAVVDRLLAQLARALEPGDVICDGGNSYWGDSIRRAERLRAARLFLLDVGTSGGVAGARRGACFMVGGDRRAVRVAEPVLRRLAVDGGYVHAGPSGAGHFAKLVHNGIEFGMLQAIGEGIDLLERYPSRLPVADVLACWRHGSVIRSWLVDLMEQSYRAHRGLARVPPTVEDTGEVNWLVDDALRLEAPIPVIAQAVMQIFASRDDRRNAARAIALMRRGFGGHPLGRDASIARERRDSRIGGFPGKRRP